MSLWHEREVATCFDRLESRFGAEVQPGDYRLEALRRAIAPAPGRRVLDLGCGKGRFAAHLARDGAEVVGLDLSGGMLRHARGIARVQGSARRLPLATASIDAAAVVEVLEHLTPTGVEEAIDELARVLRPGGVAAILDKNAGALDARRPWLPASAIKWIDERRGLWMYAPDSPVQERWFWPDALRRRLRLRFVEVEVEHLLAPAEARRRVFRRVPGLRLMTLWRARKAGGAVG